MRILYFADIRFPLERANGIQTMETCHAMARRGHTVHLIVRPDTHIPTRSPFAYYDIPPLDALVIERAPVTGPPTARRLAYLAFACGRAFGPRRADALLTRDLGVASALLRMPRGLRAPLIYESHGYAPDVSAALPELVVSAEPPNQEKLDRLAAREAHVWRDAEGYVTITAGLAEAMTSRFGARTHLAVVPDGVRLNPERTWAPPPEPAAKPPIVAYAGHLYPWKGVEVLLEALARVPDAHGVIAGGHDAEPDLARLKTVAGRLGVEDRVTFTGLLPPAQVPQVLATATVLALPNPVSAISTRFTSPLKLFEYMAAGRAIVASDLPSIREVVRHDVEALLVSPDDPDALAAAIRRLIANPALAARLGHAAFDAAAKYGWHQRAERLDALLQQVTDSRR